VTEVSHKLWHGCQNHELNSSAPANVEIKTALLAMSAMIF